MTESKTYELNRKLTAENAEMLGRMVTLKTQNADLRKQVQKVTDERDAALNELAIYHAADRIAAREEADHA